MKRWKRPASLLLAATALLLAAGCAKAPSASPAAAQPTAAAQEPNAKTPDLSQVKLRVGQTGWGTLDKGLKAAGLDNTPYKIEYSVFQGGNLQLEAMAAGHLDFASASEIPPVFAAQAAHDGNFKVIAVQLGNTLNQEIVVPQDSKIKSVADLKGKKVAYVTNTTAHYFLVKLLEQAGLSWSDITPVQLTTSDGLSALIGGNVDALASYGNAIITARQKGATVLASAKDVLSGNFLFVAPPDVIADPLKHAALADYLQRINRFYEWSRSHQQAWAEITAAQTHQPIGQALETIRDGEIQRPAKVVATSDKAVASQQDVADVLQRVGLLKEKVNVGSFWSKAFDSEINAFSGK